jgi:hypothetical protein
MIVATKEEIREILREKKSDSVETQDAKKISILGYLCILPGIFSWSLINFLSLDEAHLIFPLIILIGSGFVGIVTFLIFMGNYIYFEFHISYLKIHWLYLGVMRTISQFYFMGSLVTIFVLTYHYYPNQDFGFLISYLIFSLPAYLGYYLFRIEKTRNWVENLIIKEVEEKTSEKNPN